MEEEREENEAYCRSRRTRMSNPCYSRTIPQTKSWYCKSTCCLQPCRSCIQEAQTLHSKPPQTSSLRASPCSCTRALKDESCSPHFHAPRKVAWEGEGLPAGAVGMEEEGWETAEVETEAGWAEGAVNEHHNRGSHNRNHMSRIATLARHRCICHRSAHQTPTHPIRKMLLLNRILSRC